MSDSLWPHGLQHTRPLCASPTPRICSNSCPLSQRCHPTSSSSVIPFSSCLQSFPASGSFPMSPLSTSDVQSIRASASASDFPMNIQDWFPLGLSDLISLLSKGLSGVFSSTTVQKHLFFSAQSSLWSNSHLQHDYWKNYTDYIDLPDSSIGKDSVCNAGDPGLMPGSGRYAGEGIGYPLQYSGLENSMDCIVHRVT